MYIINANSYIDNLELGETTGYMITILKKN